MKNLYEQQKFIADSLLSPRDPDSFNPSEKDWGEADEAFDGFGANNEDQ
jgi:hypothetical protein